MTDESLDAAIDQWEREGVAHIRGALSSAEVGSLLATVDSLTNRGANDGTSVRLTNVVGLTDTFDGLLDHPSVFPLVMRFAGAHMALLGSEVYVRRAHAGVIHDLHLDGGPALWRLPYDPGGLCLTLKVQFFLTDVDTPDNGNFMYVEGSHRMRPAEITDDHVTFPQDVVGSRTRQLLAKAGDAVIFPWSLWHGVAPNNGGNVRKSVILRFGQLWIRPNDHDRMAEHTVARMTRRQRRICGYFGSQPDPMDWYFPADQATIMGQESAAR